MEFDWVDLLKSVALPIVTGFLGWVYSKYRNKEQKESDIIANFNAMRDADREFIEEARADLKAARVDLLESRNINKRLEAKLDRKNKSVRQANKCKYTMEGDGCPVLAQEEKNEHCYDIECAKCEHHNPDCQ